jgi:uncharacterized membrane protein YphA (DoxX/SURF4 family)
MSQLLPAASNGPMSPATLHWLARAGLCLAYVYSGVSKLLDFQGAMAEQTHFGLSLPALFASATIATQLGGSFLGCFAPVHDSSAPKAVIRCEFLAS